MNARMRIVGALVVVAVAAIGLATVAGPAESHDGHAQKKLFQERWHYQPDGDFDAWMNLSTSDVWLNCDDPAACGAKWDGPFTDSLADWNSQPMTVRFGYTDEVRDVDFDVNVYIEDDVPGEPGLLGFAPTFDIDGFPCAGPCNVYSGIVWIGDDAHTPPYGTANDRLATLSHEMGHIVSLAHESTDPFELLLFDCGMDDTGPIPHSVMAYDCVDPVSIGGAGESDVQPWDTCGVNHAYPDPAFGYSGCDLTTTTPSPTPSPSPTATPLVLTFVWGDVNCSGESNPIDSLALLRFDAGLAVSQAPGCPAMDDELTPASIQFAWGDVDCGGSINPVDALKVLRVDAGLAVTGAPGCPEIGSGLPVIVPS